tara:strand:+ start:252 stop:563 length:312 start_codon:yes stop_codon:yes gene_type:complete
LLFNLWSTKIGTNTTQMIMQGIATPKEYDRWIELLHGRSKSSTKYDVVGTEIHSKAWKQIRRIEGRSKNHNIITDEINASASDGMNFTRLPLEEESNVGVAST